MGGSGEVLYFITADEVNFYNNAIKYSVNGAA